MGQDCNYQLDIMKKGCQFKLEISAVKGDRARADNETSQNVSSVPTVWHIVNLLWKDETNTIVFSVLL